jgi:hypothetical protein
MNDLIAYFAWLYAGFPTRFDIFMMGFMLGTIVMFALAKAQQRYEAKCTEEEEARLRHVQF